MTPKPLRILLVEDGPGDVVLVRQALGESPAGAFTLEHVDRLSGAFERLKTGGIDVILLDLTLPDGLGLSTLGKARAQTALPIVVMTGLDEEAVALEALKEGAQDYLVKGRTTPDGLVRSLRYAIERRVQERWREDSLHNVNHELRTPLNAVYTALMLLKDFGPTEPMAKEQQELVAIAYQGAQHLIGMTDDLAEVLQSETGKLAVQPTQLALPALLGEVSSLMAIAGAARDIRLTSEASPDLPTIKADPLRVKQILFNLLGNAVKFTPKGGKIYIRATLWDKDASFVRVSVVDTGCGIDAEAAKRIFDRLYQVPGAQSRNGLGIGLYLSRELVTRQGGTIWMESQVGQGSSFHFTLPVS